MPFSLTAESSCPVENKAPTSIVLAPVDASYPDGGSLLTLAKHIDARIKSSILYEDLATAIDGGKDAKDAGAKEPLGCGKNGGQMGVTTNLTNPLYSTKAYKDSGAKSEGIIMKLVKTAPPPSAQA